MGEIQTEDKNFNLFLVWLFGACTLILVSVDLITVNFNFIYYVWIPFVFQLYVLFYTK